MKDEKVKHLEFIQGVINRLANNSFLIKGWVITLTIAGLGFYFSQEKSAILFILLFVSLSFWFMDSYYLRQERLFRRLYSDVVNDKIKQTFSMDISKYQGNISSVLTTMFSYPNLLLYIAIIVLILLEINLSTDIKLSVQLY